MSNILKNLIKKAIKEADDAAMKKSAKGMAMYGKKAKMKEQASATWDGNCGSILTHYVGNDLKALCMKCDPGIGGPGSYEQQMDPSPCDCDINGEPLADFCRSKFPNLGLGMGTGTGTNTDLGDFGPDLSIDAKPEPKKPGGAFFDVSSWSPGFDATVSRFSTPQKARRFLRQRIRGWRKKRATAGRKYRQQLDAKIQHARKLIQQYKNRRRVNEAEITAGDDNTKFKLKVDVSNKQSETKLGVRLQLTPKDGMLEPDIRDSLEAAIMKKLNTSLGQYDIQVSKDTDVPNPEVIGFFIPLSQIKNMVVKSIKGSGGTAPKPFKPDLEKDALQRDKISQMMGKEKKAQAAKQATNESIDDLISDQLITEMRQRTLNEISQIVIREDFYGFINSGNNMLRSLEERGYDMREAKKYLGYLVKHNIM